MLPRFSIRRDTLRTAEEIAMDLRAGERVGAFEILGPLGAGGMGEVHRARDTRLGRDVAIKVLPRSFSQDAERLARFDREARLLAALNHPGIGAIYGVEDSPHGRLLVLELVPGDTLADRVARGPLPISEALTICRQIADAVAYAHASGVVHRDLKPANVKYTRDGGVKVLDFGLAKALAPDSGIGRADDPTITSGETRDGAVLGTPAYMSPEQARAQDVDRRTDIWSLGCILYETLTGRRPFQERTVTDTLAAVVSRTPDWSALPASTPDAIRALLRRCLQRDRDRRLHDMSDVRIELEDALAPNESVEGAKAPPPAAGFSAIELGAAAVLALLIVVNLVVRARLVPSLTGLYAGFGLPLALPLRSYLVGSNWIGYSLAALALVWAALAIAGRPWRPKVRQAVLLASAAIVCAVTTVGLYLVAEAGLLQAMRHSLGSGTQVVKRDLVTLYLAGREPARALALIDPKRRSYEAGGFVSWGTPGEAFQLAEAYRAAGDVEAAARLYRRAQEAALAFDEVLSQQAVNTQARWESEVGVDLTAWALPIPQLRTLPDLIRTVAQQRLDQMAEGKAPVAPPRR
jgi:hypothetical protein